MTDTPDDLADSRLAEQVALGVEALNQLGIPNTLAAAIESLQRQLSEARAEGERMRAALEGAVSAWEGKSGMGTLYEMPRAISNARTALSPPAADTPKEPT